jgi:hypothetical protein
MRHSIGPKGVHAFHRLRTYEPDKWFRRIHFGLKVLGENFPVEECYWCHGSGYYRYQTCDKCEGACLIYSITANVAPASVLNQVYEAGAAFEIEV